MKNIIIAFLIIFFFSGCVVENSNSDSEKKYSQKIKFINSPEAKKNNYPFSEATIVNNIIYLSGQIGTLNNGKLVEGGIKEETRQTMMNIKSILVLTIIIIKKPKISISEQKKQRTIRYIQLVKLLKYL